MFYQLVEGLESKYFTASGEKELLHVFAAHAKPRPEMHAITSNLGEPDAASR